MPHGGGGVPDGQCSVNLLELELALQALRDTEQAAKTELRAEKPDQWHQWLTTHQTRGSGAVYRWIRDGPRPPIALTARCDPDGTWLHGRRQSVAACDEAWWAIWGKSQAETPPNMSWLAHLHTLPPYPAHTRLGHEQLRRVLSTYNANKAAGPDGWRRVKALAGPLA